MNQFPSYWVEQLVELLMPQIRDGFVKWTIQLMILEWLLDNELTITKRV
jgi:hypothetical protein